MDEYLELIRIRGKPLTELGLPERGLLRADALEAVALLEGAGVALYGGNVFVRIGDQIHDPIAVWTCDGPLGREPLASFVVRSCKRARAYIEDYPEPAAGSPLFTLVLNSSREY